MSPTEPRWVGYVNSRLIDRLIILTIASRTCNRINRIMPQRSPILFWLLLAATVAVYSVVISWAASEPFPTPPYAWALFDGADAWPVEPCLHVVCAVAGEERVVATRRHLSPCPWRHYLSPRLSTIRSRIGHDSRSTFFITVCSQACCWPLSGSFGGRHFGSDVWARLASGSSRWLSCSSS